MSTIGAAAVGVRAGNRRGVSRMAAVGSVCFGILAFQILATRLLGMVVDPSVVLFAIAFAMLGMGAAASAMSLSKPGSRPLIGREALGWVCLVLGLAYLAALAMITIFGASDSEALHQAMAAGGLDGVVALIRSNIPVKMLAVGAMLFVPFAVFGVFVAALFRSAAAGELHRLYAADLIGASLGCVGAVIALDSYGLAATLVLIVVSAFLGGALIAASPVPRWVNVAAIALVAASSFSDDVLKRLEPRPPIDLLSRNYDQRYDVTEVWRRWNAHSRIALLDMQQKAGGERVGVFAHEDGAGWALVPSAQKSWKASPVNLALALGPKSILVIFAGVGQDMFELAEKCGAACEITGVEINQDMVDRAFSGDMPHLNAFFAHPQHKLEVAEGREYLSREGRSYETILLSWWGAGTSHFVGTSGFLSQYVYTQEAFASMLQRLEDGGTIVVFNGSKAKVLVTLRELYESLGLPNHLDDKVILTKPQQADGEEIDALLYRVDSESLRLVFKPSGFTPQEVEKVTEQIKAIGLDVAMAPGFVAPGFETLREIAVGAPIAAINEALRLEQGLELYPTTDDRPFPHLLTPAANYFDGAAWTRPPGLDRQWDITRLFVVFTVALTLISCVLIIAPLLVTDGPVRNVTTFTLLAYFFILGAGFILIEVGLVQKFGLLLGHPSYAISVVLASLIFSTGMGSLISERLFAIGFVTEKRIAIAIAVYVVVLLWAHDAVAATIIALPLITKAVMVIFSIFPLGIFLGQLFPRGLKAAHAHDRRLVPWAWAVNGTTSTIFVGVGFVVSYPMGLSFLIYLGAALYLILLLLPLARAHHLATA